MSRRRDDDDDDDDDYDEDYDEDEEDNKRSYNPDAPKTFTPRGESKGCFGDRMEAFQHMQALGASFVEAAMACIVGKRMTDDIASMCIATYWKRYSAVAQFQEARGAAITLQVRAAKVCA